MKKFTLVALAAVALASTVDAQLRWNPENSWGEWANNKMNILPVGDDGKTVVNALGAGDGQYRRDMRFAGDANFIEEEPYLVIQITTENCAWNLNDYKFEFMIQRKYSEGLNDDGNPIWGGATDSYDAAYPSFDGTKYKIVDEYGADIYRVLGGCRVNNGDDDISTDDVIVIDLNNVRATDEDKTRGLLFNAGPVYMPNINSFDDPRSTIVEWDPVTGLDGVQQRSWFGLVCIAKNATVTGNAPTFTVHYTGTVSEPYEAMDVCENYAAGNGGQEVREDDPYVDAAVESVAADDLKVYLKNGKTVVAPAANSIEAYSVDGKKVAAGVNELALPNGIYVVKAKANGAEKAVKVVVR